MSDAWVQLVGEFVDAAVEDQEKATSLLSTHPELREATWRGESLPRFLAVEGFANAVRFLARSGFALDNDILFDAVSLGNVPMVELLIELGAPINCLSQPGLSPLQGAAIQGREDLVAVLLRAGADRSLEGELGDLESMVETLCQDEAAKKRVLDVLRKRVTLA